MEDKIVRILLRRYQKIPFNNGIAKVIFDDEFEDISKEIVKLFSESINKECTHEETSFKHIRCNVCDNCGDIVEMDV